MTETTAPGKLRLLRRRILWLAAALAVLAAAVLLSLTVGSRGIPLGETVAALLHGGDTTDAVVVRELRVPRTVVGLAVGAALGLAGTVMQGITRNPIADPGILGVSQGAAAGVVVAISVFGVGSPTGYVWFGFAGAALAAVLVHALAGRGLGGATPVKLALAGAAMSAFIASLNTLVLTTDSATMDQFRFWQVGSLSGRTADVAWQLMPFLLAGLLLVFAVARGLDALALGDDTAKGLGARTGLVRATGALGATVLTGSAVAAAGPIAFVGLAVPHAARALVGADHRWVLTLSAVLGPALLLLADALGRVLFPPSEVPAGVMTALVGVPVLVVLVRRRKVVAA
ncbi:iron ABC transporter permease [Kitasatospora herbaricolor]|uniref:FecCD family ABC transporter permease n=1 Tax=Kitasatospora herbaricolor TaxID=68217 RepID=UPI0017488248|nr:iron ABC transporter permease [Kitasatospora herbaricolor]MDQ0310077.1 iron complex transport system permease protein [Kitasatospora herbaricolor]GGV17696.1 iron ABC transporter permease [Kitasatospora herbaricolor]